VTTGRLLQFPIDRPAGPKILCAAPLVVVLMVVLMVGLMVVLVTGLAAGPACAAQPPSPQPSEVPADTLITVPDPDVVATAEETQGGLVNPQALNFQDADVWNTGVSPTAAVLMTPVFPGWGQLYTENSWRAALGFGLEWFYWSNIIVRDRRAVQANNFAKTLDPANPNRARYEDVAAENWEQMRDFAWWSAGVLLIIALDAYVGAHLFNFDEDPLPIPDKWEEQFGQSGSGLPGEDPGLTFVVFQWQKSF
jgi:hypothetical protein